MIGDFILVSKEEAIKRIMEAPGDTVVIGEISILDNKSRYVHEKPMRHQKNEGRKLIVAAKEIEYQNNNFFGTLSLHGIKEDTIIHNILFPQEE